MPPRHHKKPELVAVEVPHHIADFWLQRINSDIGLGLGMLKTGILDHKERGTVIGNIEKARTIRDAIMKGKYG